MKVICAWCQSEGKPAVVREKEPINDPEETHGVRARHKAKLKDPPASHLPGKSMDQSVSGTLPGPKRA